MGGYLLLNSCKGAAHSPRRQAGFVKGWVLAALLLCPPVAISIQRWAEPISSEIVDPRKTGDVTIPHEVNVVNETKKQQTREVTVAFRSVVSRGVNFSHWEWKQFASMNANHLARQLRRDGLVGLRERVADFQISGPLYYFAGSSPVIRKSKPNPVEFSVSACSFVVGARPGRRNLAQRNILQEDIRPLRGEHVLPSLIGVLGSVFAQRLGFVPKAIGVLGEERRDYEYENRKYGQKRIVVIADKVPDGLKKTEQRPTKKAWIFIIGLFVGVTSICCYVPVGGSKRDKKKQGDDRAT